MMMIAITFARSAVVAACCRKGRGRQTGVNTSIRAAMHEKAGTSMDEVEVERLEMKVEG